MLNCHALSATLCYSYVLLCNFEPPKFFVRVESLAISSLVFIRTGQNCTEVHTHTHVPWQDFLSLCKV